MGRTTSFESVVKNAYKAMHSRQSFLSRSRSPYPCEAKSRPVVLHPNQCGTLGRASVHSQGRGRHEAANLRLHHDRHTGFACSDVSDRPRSDFRRGRKAPAHHLDFALPLSVIRTMAPSCPDRPTGYRIAPASSIHCALKRPTVSSRVFLNCRDCTLTLASLPAARHTYGNVASLGSAASLDRTFFGTTLLAQRSKFEARGTLWIR